MFNKEAFKYRLDFHIRTVPRAIAPLAEKLGAEAYNLVVQNLWESCMSVMWETRNIELIEMGCTDREMYSSFSILLTMGFNQLNDSIKELHQVYMPDPLKLAKIQVMIMQKVNELADEVEELLTYTNHNANG